MELVPRAALLGVGTEGAFDSVDDPAACACATTTAAGAGEATLHVLLNLTTAPKGSPLHALSMWASRVEDLAHVLAWGRSG